MTLEMSHSGLVRSPAKGVGVDSPSRVRIPPSPLVGAGLLPQRLSICIRSTFRFPFAQKSLKLPANTPLPECANATNQLVDQLLGTGFAGGFTTLSTASLVAVELRKMRAQLAG